MVHAFKEFFNNINGVISTFKNKTFIVMVKFAGEEASGHLKHKILGSIPRIL
jgi:hypothetical protein